MFVFVLLCSEFEIEFSAGLKETRNTLESSGGFFMGFEKIWENIERIYDKKWNEVDEIKT